MAKIRYGLFLRGQFPREDDMVVRMQELFEQARRADELGFGDLMVGMHYASYPLWMPSMMPFLARLTGEAPNARLCAGIVLLSLHKPLDIAEQFATIDAMSNGRVVFGAGLGYREVEFNAFGTTQSDRVARFEENLEAVVRLWTEDNVTIKGSHFELNEVNIGMKPVQKPHPPIWIGANADGAVKRAARMADTWFINPHQKMETIERQLDIYKAELDNVGKPFPDELPLMREIFVAPTRAEALERARPYIEQKYKVYVKWGQDKAMPKEDRNLSADFDELTKDRFLIGSPDEIVEQIVGYHKRLGVNNICLGAQGVGMPQSQLLEAIQLFSEEVMPRVEQAL
jgi:alkanesulfonate monooxygenase SsuD/methylene tetrahydromethanopterin reductase-like flavin-dependent oxidoreductase (luciferase family)